MKVCVLLPVLDAFKGGNHLPLLASCEDIEFTILTNRVKPRDCTLPPNVSVLTIPGRIGSYYYGIADALFARAVLKEYPPDSLFWKQFDAIHLNQTFGPALRRLTQTGKPVSLLIHHPVSVDRAIAIEESSWPVSWLWRLKYALLWRWQRSLASSGIAVATVSQTAAKRIAADYGIDAATIAIIPNGVATPSALESTAEDFDVIALGSFVHPRKGFPYLLKVYRALADEGYKVADVGRRTDAQRAALARIPSVKVFGTVPGEQLENLLCRSKVLVSTSLYEGFGLSLIEALANGKPCYAFGGGAVGEVLSPIDPDLVVPLRDVEMLVGRIRHCLSLSPSDRRMIGERYRSAVLERYPLKRSGESLRDFFNALVAKPFDSGH